MRPINRDAIRAAVDTLSPESLSEGVKRKLLLRGFKSFLLDCSVTGDTTEERLVLIERAMARLRKGQISFR